MHGISTKSARLALAPKIERLTRRLPVRYVPILAGVVVVVGIAVVLLSGGGEGSSSQPQPAPLPFRPGAVDHLPAFITSPGALDILLVVMAAILVGAVLAMGVLFFWLHSLPERLVHKSTKVHLDIVAVLALLSLFTHVHLFWVAALLIALVKVPDFSFFSRNLQRMTVSLERIADGQPKASPASSATAGETAPRNERMPC
jgi:hypothetical protein